MILPPRAYRRTFTPPPLPAVHDADALLTYQSPQLQRHINRLAIVEAHHNGIDLDGATDPQEIFK